MKNAVCSGLSSIITARTRSVSYTHLDVYKRQLLDAVRLMEKGLDAGAALDMGLTNKSFDPYEQNLVRDLIRARIPKKLEREKLFAD